MVSEQQTLYGSCFSLSSSPVWSTVHVNSEQRCFNLFRVLPATLSRHAPYHYNRTAPAKKPQSVRSPSASTRAHTRRHSPTRRAVFRRFLPFEPVIISGESWSLFLTWIWLFVAQGEAICLLELYLGFLNCCFCSMAKKKKRKRKKKEKKEKKCS